MSESLTRHQAARFLEIHVRTLDEWRAQKYGPPFYRLGRRRVRYKRSDLEEWQNRQRTAPES